jgi:hypothetical protein
MNDRILEHAFQAEFINKRVRDNSYFIDDPELMAKLEKFAELIVKECASTASNWVMDTDGSDMGVASAVKQHFGVDE